jgi:hypothetical protein
MSWQDLRYFVLEYEGNRYGGWYRLLGSKYIEVIAPGLLTSVPLHGETPEKVSCGLLEQFVRARLEQGAPMPTAMPFPAPSAPEHVCIERDEPPLPSD